MGRELRNQVGPYGASEPRLEQANTELLARLEERDAELKAARVAYREPTRTRTRRKPRTAKGRPARPPSFQSR